MPTKTTINLAELAVIAEEFAQSTEGLTAEVVPATTLQLDPSEVETVVAGDGEGRVILATDPTPHDVIRPLMDIVEQRVGAFSSSSVDFASLPDPAAITLTFNDEVVGVMFASEPQLTPNAGPSDGVLSIGVLRHVPLEVAAELGRAKVPWKRSCSTDPARSSSLIAPPAAPLMSLSTGQWWPEERSSLSARNTGCESPKFSDARKSQQHAAQPEGRRV